MIYFNSPEIMESLMYHSYKAQRDSHPEIEPSRWRSIYINQEKYEKTYQGEKND